MQQIQEQPVNIAEARETFRGLLTDQNRLSQARLRAAETAVSEAQAAVSKAQAEMEVAKAAATAAETELSSYNATFPLPQKGKGAGKSAAASAAATTTATTATGKAGKNGGQSKTTKGGAKGKGGQVVINPPLRHASGNTVPDRMARIMGDKLWTAGDLLDALSNAGEKFKSTNLRGYISTTLNSADQNVPGPTGALTYPGGGLVKVHRFTNVSRGQYRVATPEDIQAELKTLLGVSEVVMSGTPADRIFGEQGIEAPRAISTQH